MCVSDEYIMLHFPFFFLLKGKWMLIALWNSIHFPLSESVSALFFLLPAKWIQEHFNWIGDERVGINDTTQLNQHQQLEIYLSSWVSAAQETAELLQRRLDLNRALM